MKSWPQSLPKREQITFSTFTLDTVDESLWNGSTKIPLRPKSFALLQCLVENTGLLVTRDQLLSVLWPNCRVGEGALKRLVSEIRKVLHDNAETPQWIETAHGRGYRFIGHIGRNQISAEPTEALIRVREEPAICRHLVGRASELALLHQLLEEAQHGIRQIVFVSGERGAGKTALVDAFLDQTDCGGNGIRIARGQCMKSHGLREAYMPFYEALTVLCRQSCRRQIVSLLQKNAPLWLLQMPSVISKTQLRDLRKTTVGSKHSRMLREMAEALEVLCSEIPLVLVLEDLHWSDSSTLDLISYLALRRERARLLLVGTYRPSEAAKGGLLKSVLEELQTHSQCHGLALRVFNNVEITALEWQKHNAMQSEQPALEDQSKGIVH